MIPYMHDTHPCTRRKNNKTLIAHEMHSASNHFSSSRHTWVVNSTYACMTYACKASTQALPSKIPQFFLEKPYFWPPAAPAKKFTYEKHPSFNLLHYTDFVRWITDPQATGSTQWHAGPTCTKDNCNGLFKCSSRVIREPPPNAQEVRPRPWQEIWNMTLFSIENSKSVNLVLTPYGNHRIKIVLCTECQILAGSQQSSCRFGNLVPTMYRSNQYNIWRTTRGNWGNFTTTSSGQISRVSEHDRGTFCVLVLSFI